MHLRASLRRSTAYYNIGKQKKKKKRADKMWFIQEKSFFWLDSVVLAKGQELDSPSPSEHSKLPEVQILKVMAKKRDKCRSEYPNLIIFFFFLLTYMQSKNKVSYPCLTKVPYNDHSNIMMTSSVLSPKKQRLGTMWLWKACVFKMYISCALTFANILLPSL